MENLRGLAVHQLGRPNHRCPIRMADRLMTKTHPKHRDPARGERPNRLNDDARSLRATRTRRQQNTIGVKPDCLLDRHRVISMHDRVGTNLAQVLHQVVNERVVRVDHQDASHTTACRMRRPKPPLQGLPVRGTARTCLDCPVVAPPKRKTGGRVTPKGGDQNTGTGPSASSRYTPPVPEAAKVSPQWVPVLMLTLLILGVIVIMLRNLVFAGNSWLLLVGLGCVLGGLYTATKWR